MIKVIKQDILTVTKGIVCHQVNCFGRIGGLAGAINRQWQENGKEYTQYIASQIKKMPRICLLGQVCDVKVGSNLYVANIFGQYSTGTHKQQTEYSALINGLQYVAYTNYLGDDTKVEETCFGVEVFPNLVTDVYIPYGMGCGLGGGDWSLVQNIIERVFEKAEKDVFICTL